MVRNRRPPLPPPRDLHRPLLSARATQSLSPTYPSPEVASSPGYDELDPSLYLNDTERWWRDHQPWLEQSGYLLRARYRPDWVPSWEGKGFFSKLHVYEDMVELPVGVFYYGASITIHGSPLRNPGQLAKNACYKVIGWVPCSSLPRVQGDVPRRSGHNAPPRWRQRKPYDPHPRSAKAQPQIACACCAVDA
jgi:hypothetical protein